MMPGVFAAPMLRGGGGGGGGPYPASAFFNSDPITTTGWEVVSYPSGFYHSGKTYVAWQYVGLSGHKGIHVAAYDHGSGSWSERYTAGNFLLPNDDHGHPALVRDADGYIHCFFGSHVNAQKWSTTTAPDDISGWTQRAEISGSNTYPRAVRVGSTIYLFTRSAGASNSRILSVRTITPTGGAGTPSSAVSLIYFGADTIVYSTEAHVVGTAIHVCSTFAAAGDTSRRHVYYMIYETTTGAISNFDGSTTIASGSLPVTLAQATASFRIFTPAGINDGDVPSLQFDSSGNAHVLFADGVTPNYDLKHMMLSGGSWTSPVTVAAITDISPTTGYVGAYCLTPGASGAMEAWYNVAGDKMRRVRSSGGTWATAETIATAGTYDFVQCTAIRGANSELRTLFAESCGDAVDANAALLGLYAYGDNGGVPAVIPMTSIDPNWGAVTVMYGFHSASASFVVNDAPAAILGTLNGNPSFTTSIIPFSGASSLRLDGSGDWVEMPHNAAFSMNATNQTFECFLRIDETGRLQLIAGKRQVGTANEWQLLLAATNNLQFIAFGAGGAVVVNIIGSTTLTTGVWYHAAVCKEGTACRLYLDGALEASGTFSGSVATNTLPFRIGRDPTNTGRDLNGWLSEVRMTEAARYTTAFTPPTAPFPRR